ncbi:MAG: hypothetical protein C4567_11810 [Deltaproteobacteria bacterium]|nr:MAG: hypothetical protein C4567_11810 [Deltaproteobacteria bacterium]
MMMRNKHQSGLKWSAVLCAFLILSWLNAALASTSQGSIPLQPDGPPVLVHADHSCCTANCLNHCCANGLLNCCCAGLPGLPCQRESVPYFPSLSFNPLFSQPEPLKIVPAIFHPPEAGYRAL